MSGALKTLGNLCMPQPKSQVKAGEGLASGKYKFFTSSNIQDKFYNEYQYDKPALIFGTGGNASVHYCEEPFSTSTDCIVLYAKDKTVNLKAIYRYIESNMHLLEEGFHGAGLKHISKTYLLNITINSKLFEIQDKLVGVLDKIGLLIEKRQQQLEKLDFLIKSKFIEMFENINYPRYTMKSIANYHQGTQVAIELQSDIKESNMDRFLRIIDYTQPPQKPRYVKVNGYKVSKKSIVIVRYGATAGFVGRGYDGVLANNLFEVIPNENLITKNFLYCYLKYGTFEKEISKKVAGAAMPAISFGLMDSVEVVIPPMSLQEKFVSFVERIDGLKFTINQSLEKLETLKKALMQKYFG